MSDTAAAEALTFDVMITLEDQVALQMRYLTTPAMRAGRLRRWVASTLIATALAPLVAVGGVLAAWVGDRQGPPLGSLFHFLVFDDPGLLAMAVLVMVTFSVGGQALKQRMVRPRLRRVMRRMLRARPDVDPSDPQLAFRCRVIVGDEGLESRSDTGVTVVRWDTLKRWDETGGYLTVLGDAVIGMCLRVAAVDPESMDRLRASLTARVGPRSASR